MEYPFLALPTITPSHRPGLIGFLTVWSESDEIGAGGGRESELWCAEAYLLCPESGELRRIVGPIEADDTTYPLYSSWSADGSRIVFSRGNLMSIFDTDGGEVQTLETSIPRSWCHAWSPDRKLIAFSGSEGDDPDTWGPQNGIYTIAADGSGERRAWSPDGSVIAFRRQERDQAGIHLIDASGAGLRQLTSHSGDMDPRWSPDGQLILVNSYGRECRVTVVNAETGVESPLALGHYMNAAWSPDSTGFACTPLFDHNRTRTLVHVTAEGKQTVFKQLYQTPTFCWSPDGTRLALSDGRDVVLIDRNGQNMERLCAAPSNVDSIHWFPAP
jgi:Tol biopolymer transport system component